MSEWISINDKLPDFEEVVEIYGKADYNPEEFGEFHKFHSYGYRFKQDIYGGHYKILQTSNNAPSYKRIHFIKINNVENKFKNTKGWEVTHWKPLSKPPELIK